MRVLDPGYTATHATRSTRPLYRVYLANHGGAFADPLEITAYIASMDVVRTLREGNSATIVLHNATGEYDPLTGVYAAAIRACNAEVRIDLGETIAGVATYWRVLTGEIAMATPSYSTGPAIVVLDVLDRGRNPWQYQITSPNYDINVATPVSWTAHEMIRDLFEKFAGFTWPGDFDLDPASDWTVGFPVQFETEPLADAAAKVLQPKGYRLYFNYDGQLDSGLLVPPNTPGTWALDGTLDSANIELIDGPISQPPLTSRVLVTGSPLDHDIAYIGQHSVLGTSRFWYNFTTHWNSIGTGDCYWCDNTGWIWLQWRMILWLQGPLHQRFRDRCSHIGAVRYAAGDVTALDYPPVVLLVSPASDRYSAAMDRHTVAVDINVANPFALAGNNIDFEFDVYAHPAEVARPHVYCQDWDDGLIARWGDQTKTVEAPLAANWTDGQMVADQEMTIATLSENAVRGRLKRLDLRPEPGDVVDMGEPRRGTVRAWLHTITHVLSPRAAHTEVSGYVIPP